MTQQKGNHKITSINAEKLWIKHNIHVWFKIIFCEPGIKGNAYSAFFLA
jgi:hypothetical protein